MRGSSNLQAYEAHAAKQATPSAAPRVSSSFQVALHDVCARVQMTMQHGATMEAMYAATMEQAMGSVKKGKKGKAKKSKKSKKKRRESEETFGFD